MSDERASPGERERPGEGPGIELIDARALGLADEAALREHARRVSAQTGAPHTSRSYSYPLALIAWHAQEVGCDIERVAPCDAAFADSIRTPAERAAALREQSASSIGASENGDSPDSSPDSSPSPDAAADRAAFDRRITSLWSSKEALAKALGDALDYDPRRLEGPCAWPDGRSGSWRARALEPAEEYVGWVCWRETRPHR